MSYVAKVVRVTSDADGQTDAWQVEIQRIATGMIIAIPEPGDLPADISRALLDWLAPAVAPAPRIPRDPNFPMEQP